MQEAPTIQGEKQGSEKQPKKPKELSKEFKAHIWQKGQSGNPGGRQKGLAHTLKEMTNNGQVIFDYLVSLIDGSAHPPPKHRERVEAAKIVLDRAYGKAVETSVQIRLNDDNNTSVAALTDAQLAALAGHLKPALLNAPRQDVSEDVVDAEVQPIPTESLSNPDKDG